MSTQRYRWLIAVSAILVVVAIAAFAWYRDGHSNHSAEDQSVVLTGVIPCFTLEQPSYTEPSQGKSQYEASSYVKGVFADLNAKKEKKPTTTK